MALDSIGHDYTKKVLCFLCGETKLTFEVYKPQYGHDGGQLLDYGACIRKDTLKNHENGELFEIKPNPQKADCVVVFQPYTLQASGRPYHYGGAYLPNFGESVGQIIFVCGQCRMKYDTKTFELLNELDTVFLDKVNERLGDLLSQLFVEGIITVPKTYKQKFSRIKLENQKKLSLKLKGMLHDITGMYSNHSIRRVHQKLRRLTLLA